MIYSQNEKRLLHILLSKFRIFFWGGGKTIQRMAISFRTWISSIKFYTIVIWPSQTIMTNLHHCLAEIIGKGTTNRCKLQAVWRSKRISDDLYCGCYRFDCSHLKKMDSLWTVLEHQQHEADSHQQQFTKMSDCWPWQNHFCIQEYRPGMQGSGWF